MSRTASTIFFAFLATTTLLFSTQTADALELSPGGIQNNRATAFSGTIATVSNCYTPSGYAFTVGTSSSVYIFQPGITNPYPVSAVPQVGTKFFAVLGTSTTTCDRDSSSVVSSSIGTIITYYSVSVGFETSTTTPPGTETPPNTGNTNQNNGSGGNSGQGIFSQLQNLLNDLFKPPAAQGGAGGGLGGTGVTPPGTTGSLGMMSPFNFGGIIGKVLPCDPTASFPPGTEMVVTIAGPKPGLFTYGTYSRPYLCGPAIVPGKQTLGSYTPGAGCDIDLDPETVVMIQPVLGWMNMLPGHGTSGCVAPSQQEEPPPPSTDCADVTAAICSAANSSVGMSSFGAENTNNGRLACAWAVNQVLAKAGVAPVDGLNVGSMENVLLSGRGKAVSQSQAQCGDIVIQAGRHHVGICLNAGCTRVISNSSSRAAFNWFSGTDFLPSYQEGPGRIYRVQCKK